jgi:hypothetical protein
MNMKIKKYTLLIFFFISFVSWAPLSFGGTDPLIFIQLRQGTLMVNPKGLGMAFRTSPQNMPTVIIPDHQLFMTPKSITKDQENYKIQYEGIEVILRVSKESICFELYPGEDLLLEWPFINETKDLETWFLPEGEGLFVSLLDQKIRSVLENKTLDQSHMLPFVGLIYKDFGLTIIEHTPYRNVLKISALGQGIHFNYNFRKRDKKSAYKLSFTFSEPTLLAPAKIYKDFLKLNQNFIPCEV